jgi:hypothetical protein
VTLQVYNVPGLLSPVCNTCLEPYTPTFDCYTPTEWAGSTASPSPPSAPLSVLPPSLLTVPGRAPTIRTISDGTVVNDIYPECPYVLQPNTEDDNWGNGHNWDEHNWGHDWNLDGWNNTVPAATWGTPPPTPPATPPPPPEPSVAAGELAEEEVTTLVL